MPPDLPLSRRDFLAAAALGAAGMARGLPAAPGTMTARDELPLYVGTYTRGERAEGIHLLALDARTGALSRRGAFDAGPDPSFLALHPDGRTLYAVNEVTERAGAATGAVTALRVARGTGALSRLGEQPSRGAAPCYVSVDRDGRFALVANYVGGSVALLPLGADGALAPASHLDRHQGRGPDAERQDAPHAHCIIPDPTGRWALAADLGIDRVLVYRVDVAGRAPRLSMHGEAAMAPGAGPRHLAFHPVLPLAFVSNELDSTVTAMRWDAGRGALTVLASHSTLPDGWSGKNQVADLHVAPSGRELYVSNRGHDSVATFAAEPDGRLVRRQVEPAGGHWPRNFALDPTGRWVVVANERSNSLAVLARDASTGALSATPHRLEVPSPVCVLFRDVG